MNRANFHKISKKASTFNVKVSIAF